MGQKIKFWLSARGLWRVACSLGHLLQLAIIGFILFLGVNLVAEAIHKPILADHAPPHLIVPAAHAK